MATVAHSPPPQDGPSSPLNGISVDVLATNVHKAFPRGLAISDLDLKDDRYPVISSSRIPPPQHNVDALQSPQQFYPDAVQQAVNSAPNNNDPLDPDDTFGTQKTSQLREVDKPPSPNDPAQEQQDTQDKQYPSRMGLTESPVSNHYPSTSPQRTPGQYSATEGFELFPPSPASSGDPARPSPPGIDAAPALTPQRQPWQPTPRDFPSPQQQDYPRQESYAPRAPPMATMSGSPPYGSQIPIPVSPNVRAPAQQPTYITPAAAPNAMNPVFASPGPGEEVCVECAMRDQDMADVDVTSLGIWARASDVHYEELLRRELEEESVGVPPSDPNRPRARGGRLSEANMKLWLSLNPKESSSKRNALDQYIKSQRSLLEAEALAHARAMQESRQIDDRMRDTYSQLRRSAYDLGSAAAPIDDTGGVRIKAIRASTVSNSTPVNAHSRDITLLENGMIVEHVDVRREEREERERRKREEKMRARARKSSRGSAIDVSSMYSSTSPLPHTDSGFHLGVSTNSRYSTSRPMSVLTAPMDYRTPHAQSTASVEAQSMISSSSPNRRTRFFGMRNFSTGFRSSDSLAPSGFSGSMVDMHVALQRENARNTMSPGDNRGSPPSIIGGWRNSSVLVPQRGVEEQMEEKPKKKKKGLAKIWRLVTGSSKNDVVVAVDGSVHTRSLDRGPDDDFPLAPPPPISYLVNRSSGEHTGSALRHVSTPSLPSSASPNFALSSAGVSPPTAPSSLLPSPTSSRPAPEGSESRKNSGHTEYEAEHPSPVEEEPPTQPSQRNVHPVTSEPDMRQRSSQLMSGPAPPVPRIPATISGGRPQSLAWREKSLPPLPGESTARFPTHPQLEPRPRTLFSYDMRQMQLDGEQSTQLTTPQAPFRQGDVRRQSFGGISARPNLLIQTVPERRSGFPSEFGMNGAHPTAEKYDQFGASRGSLGPLDGSKHNQPAARGTPGKRKSRFGIASLLGKKSPAPERASAALLGVEFPVTRSSGSEARHEALMNEMGSSGSGSGHAFPRMSMSARKNIEELVDQSPDFVAYRYPSNDQNIALLR
ncbi:hypothetical protein BV25DRAFT_1500377 [Artomyces pyxidatus]|uniref:Uncharacterized protein n=1 Tax=Artomyces pyxidatus TaxID=48021 RepID=A0ACB8TBF4_9AGAM|nr:hypothetical protein BV25DRAFT_1500377 [Artomyces pyxidatus]